MSYFNNVLEYLKAKRQRALDGQYNCIPLPFKRFKNVWPGFQMGKYICVTANQKIGKTKLCDFIFLYETIDFLLKNDNVRAKILYFCLEESPRKKYIDFLSHLLFRLDKITISNSNLESVDKDFPVDPDILELFNTERYQRYIKKFEEVVSFYNISNPTGINKTCRQYAEQHGKYNHVNYTTIGPDGKEVQLTKLDPINPYTPDDSEEYRIVILDNYANLTTESGMNKRETIEKMSKYFISLRDQLNYTIIAIQHQAQAQEGIENFKLNKIKPSSDGLGDAKTISRDLNMLIGLYSPFKYGIREYEGYDITKFKNHIRFMEVLEDRDYGSGNQICPLYFNGATSYFSELPKPNESAALSKVYEFIEETKKRKPSVLMMLTGFITNNKLFKND